MLDLKHNCSPARSTVQVIGELGIDTMGLFHEVMQKVETYNSKELVLDFDRLEFIDSTGVRALVDLLKQAEDKKQKLVIMNINDQVYNILELIGVMQLFAQDKFVRK